MARLLRRRADKCRHIRVAADDAMQDDDVGRIGELRLFDDVSVTPLHATLQSGFVQQPFSLGFIRGGELDVCRVIRARVQ